MKMNEERVDRGLDDFEIELERFYGTLEDIEYFVSMTNLHFNELGGKKDTERIRDLCISRFFLMSASILLVEQWHMLFNALKEYDEALTESMKKIGKPFFDNAFEGKDYREQLLIIREQMKPYCLDEC